MDYIELAQSAQEDHRSWKDAAPEIDHGMGRLYATAEKAPLLAECVIELESENARLRKALRSAASCLSYYWTGVGAKVDGADHREAWIRGWLEMAKGNMTYDGPTPPTPEQFDAAKRADDAERDASEAESEE